MKERFLSFNCFIASLVLLNFISIYANADEVIGCGGFIKSNTEINYKIIKVKITFSHVYRLFFIFFIN